MYVRPRLSNVVTVAKNYHVLRAFEDDLCLTESCIMAAGTILSSLDRLAYCLLH
jgi:hypothetical protein